MKKCLSIILLMLSIFSLTACTSLFETASNGNNYEGKSEENVIKIGVFEPQTGRDAEGGKESVLGVQYAHKNNSTITLNDEKYKVKLIVKDNKSTYNGGLAAAEELVNEGVCAVIGSYSAEALKGAYEVFENAGIPVISPLYASEYKSNKESLIFSLTPTVYEEVSFVADYMINTLKISKASIFCNVEDSLCTAYSLLFKEAFNKYGGETVTENFEGGDADYNKLIESVKKNKSYAVYAPLSSEKMKILTDSAILNKLAVPVFTSKYFKTNELKNYVSVKNINIFAPYFLELSAYGDFYVNLTEWIEKDEDRIYLNGGSKATALNLLSCDAYSLLTAAIKQASSYLSEDIITALCTISFTTGSGEVSFDNNGNRLKFGTFIEKTDTTP